MDSLPLKALLAVLIVALAIGCASKGRPLMPTPSLYQDEPGKSALFLETSPERRRPGTDLSV